MRSLFGMGARQNANVPKLVALYEKMGGVRAHLTQCFPNDIGQFTPFIPLADIPIWRQHSDETLFKREDPINLASRLVNTITAAGVDPRKVSFHGHNEAGISKVVCDWELAFALEIIKLGGNAIVGNFNPGSPEFDQIENAKDLIVLASERPNRVRIGLHEYFPVLWDRGLGHMVGRFVYWQRWIKEYNEKNILKLKQPHYVITEFGSDWMDPRWQVTLPLTSPYGEARGYNSLANAYKHLLDKELPDAYWLQCENCAEKVYNQSFIDGVLLYNWNSQGSFGSGREKEMDLSNADDYQKKLVAYAVRPQTATPIPPMDSPDWSEDMVITVNGAWANLRNQPIEQQGNILIKILTGDRVQIIRDPAYGKWIALKVFNSVVKTEKTVGFVHGDWVTFSPSTQPEQNWKTNFDETELKTINYALAYTGDFPDPGANLKKIIKKLVALQNHSL